MNQPTFADLDYESKKRKTRRGSSSHGLSLGKVGRASTVLSQGRSWSAALRVIGDARIHCVQLFYNLSDPGMEDMLYEVESVRRFVGLRLPRCRRDDDLKVRHLLEEHERVVCSRRSTALESKGSVFRRGR